MARKLPDAAEHVKPFTPGVIKKIEAIKLFVETFSRNRIHLHAKDYDIIKSQLKDSGWDVARGFKIGGAKAFRYTGG